MIVKLIMTVREMEERYRNGEDPFDLTIEKWVRIRDFLNDAISLPDFKKVLEGAVIPVPFCFEYRTQHCLHCPLEEICGRGEGENLFKILRIIHAYCLAGDMLPKEPLLLQAEDFLLVLERCKAEAKRLVH